MTRFWKEQSIACILLMALIFCLGCTAQTGNAPIDTGASDEQKILEKIDDLKPDAAYRLSPYGPDGNRFEDGQEHVVSIGLDSRASGYRDDVLNLIPELSKLTHLRTLSISSNFSDAELSRLPSLPNIVELFIAPTSHIDDPTRFDNSTFEMTDEGLKHFSSMTNLAELNISNTGLDGSGLRFLKEFDKLERFTLAGNPIEDIAVPHIVQNFPRLEVFDFDETKLTEEGWILLAELPLLENVSLPDVNLDEVEGQSRKEIREYERAAKKAMYERFDAAQLQNAGGADQAAEPSDEQEIIDKMDDLKPDIGYRLSHYCSDRSRFADGKEHVVSIELDSRAPEHRDDVLNLMPELSKLKHLRILEISSNFSDSELSRLPSLPNVADLVIDPGANDLAPNVGHEYHSSMTDEGLEHFSSMTNLVHLTIRNTSLNGSGLRFLKGFDKLESLSLENNPIEDIAVPHIVENFPRLEAFGFDEANLTEEGWILLAELPLLEKVSFPDVNLDEVEGRPWKEIREYERAAKKPMRERFEASGGNPPIEIDTSDEQKIIKKVKDLKPAAGYHWSLYGPDGNRFEDGKEHLVSIELRSRASEHRDDVLNLLPELSKLEHLRTLEISSNFSDPELSRLPSLPNIVELFIAPTSRHGTPGKLDNSTHEMTDEGLEHFSSMTNLASLTIRSTHLNGSGLRFLKGFDKLESLTLEGNPIEDIAVPHIVENFPRLKVLTFSETNLTEEGWLLLAELPLLENVSLPALSLDDAAGLSRSERRKNKWRAKNAMRDRFDARFDAAGNPPIERTDEQEFMEEIERLEPYAKYHLGRYDSYDEWGNIVEGDKGRVVRVAIGIHLPEHRDEVLRILEDLSKLEHLQYLVLSSHFSDAELSQIQSLPDITKLAH